MDKKEQIIQELKKAYWKEIETTMNYIPNSINPDGILAEKLKDVLSEEVNDEINHARKLANRIKDLEGMVPGSYEFTATQTSLQPPDDTTDLKTIVEGVIEAEEDAIAQYKHIIELCDGSDYVTQDMCVALLEDEENHLRIFKGFLLGLNNG